MTRPSRRVECSSPTYDKTFPPGGMLVTCLWQGLPTGWNAHHLPMARPSHRVECSSPTYDKAFPPGRMFITYLWEDHSTRWNGRYLSMGRPSYGWNARLLPISWQWYRYTKGISCLYHVLDIHRRRPLCIDKKDVCLWCDALHARRQDLLMEERKTTIGEIWRRCEFYDSDWPI